MGRVRHAMMAIGWLERRRLSSQRMVSAHKFSEGNPGRSCERADVFRQPGGLCGAVPPAMPPSRA